MSCVVLARGLFTTAESDLIKYLVIDGVFLFCFQLTSSIHVSLTYFDIDNNYMMFKSAL